LWNPVLKEVHQWITIMSQLKPVPYITIHFPKTHLYVMLPVTPVSAM